MSSELEKALAVERVLEYLARLKDNCERLYLCPLTDEQLKASLQSALAKRMDEMITREVKVLDLNDLLLAIELLNKSKTVPNENERGRGNGKAARGKPPSGTPIN